MKLPTREEAQRLLREHVKDEYQVYHANMVATAMEGYAEMLGEDRDKWFLTGLLHDLDFEKHPETHPKESLSWFKDWEYPEDMIGAVEAHAYGYNGFSRLPETKLASALMACDEISGIFYAYRKLNPISYGEMKASSIKKRFAEKNFAAKIDRAIVERGVTLFGLDMDTHIQNLIKFFSKLS